MGKVKCPICGGRATIGWYPHLQEGECWCHDCGVSIRKHFDSREDAEPYFENFGKHEPQTADEMFAELGYEKIVHDGHVSYDSMVSGDVVAVEDGQATFTDIEGTFAFCVDTDVVKATARKIEEMEAEK